MAFFRVYMVFCAVFGQLAAALAQVSEVNWFWVILSMAVAGSSVIVGLQLDRASVVRRPADAPSSVLYPQDTGTSKNPDPLGSASLTGLLLGLLLYLIYQVFLLIQMEVWSYIVPTVDQEARNIVWQSAHLSVFIQTQFIVAVFGIFLGGVFLRRGRNVFVAVPMALLSLVFCTVVAHAVAISLTGAGYLAFLDGINLMDAGQGLLTTWAILCGSLIVGALIARVIK